ncbi:acetoin dehydrogenase [Dacryopinax primogenitus]|uniref:3-oxoacyl-[acyl-carrier-protein] reductase n=1 Tax=Dacryopinax primogenitus (strain DJM 731) TaxID=1858805 RepID=M5FUC0_DACPD|nr:acetoin dehydrogenase [Dacryopinax primogenitus]EJU01316.1 acetoin dehydrogenase [Dacryopinax primogenitus]
MSTSTTSKVAIITGAESGIGRQIAYELAERGYDIGATWFDSQEEGQKVCERVRAMGRRAELLHLDLTVLPDSESLVDDFIKLFGDLDLLVNCAGVGRRGTILEIDWNDWRRTFSICVDGPFLLSQRACKHWVAHNRPGVIINITSVHEHTPHPRSMAYNSAKHALGGMTKTLAVDMAKYGIRCVAVAPGMIATASNGMDEDKSFEYLVRGLPAQRPGHPREIAKLVAFLASEDAGYITGTSFAVDGGFLVTNAQFPPPGLQVEEGGKEVPHPPWH